MIQSMGFVLLLLCSKSISLLLPIITVLQFLILNKIAFSCNIEHCAEMYRASISETDITQGSNLKYCQLLETYTNCLPAGKSCRGDLNYHTTSLFLSQWYNKYECRQILADETTRLAKLRARIKARKNRGHSSKRQHLSKQQTNTNTNSNINLNERLNQDVLYYEYGITYTPSPPSANPLRIPKDAIKHQRQKSVEKSNGQNAIFKPSYSDNYNSAIASQCTYDPRSRATSRSEELKLKSQSIPLNKRVVEIPPSFTPNWYCSLFGDPHLVRYDNSFETCRISGAWPLINNPYFSVQVTSQTIAGPYNTYDATVITAITVIIKENYPCAEEKIYEARSNYVPSTFTDDTTTAGLGFDKAVSIKTRDAGNHIDIKLRYIGAYISIRKHQINDPNDNLGKEITKSFLSIAVSIPPQYAIPISYKPINNQNNVFVSNSPETYFSRENVERYHQNPEYNKMNQASPPFQLCWNGCPKQEQIDIYNVFRKANSTLVNPNKTVVDKNRYTITLNSTAKTDNPIIIMTPVKNLIFNNNNGLQKRNPPNYMADLISRPSVGEITSINERNGNLSDEPLKPIGSKINYSNLSPFSVESVKPLDISFGTKLPQLMGMTLSQAVKQCRTQSITDIFLDACTYDLLTTGQTQFAHNARVSYQDYIRLSNLNLRSVRRWYQKRGQKQQLKYFSTISRADLLPLISNNRTNVLLSAHNYNRRKSNAMISNSNSFVLPTKLSNNGKNIKSKPISSSNPAYKNRQSTGSSIIILVVIVITLNTLN